MIASTEPTDTLISADELAQALDPETPSGALAKLLIVDCRFSLADPTRGEAAWRDARIPGARYAHLERDLSSRAVPGHSGRHPLPSRDDFVARLRRFGVEPDSRLVAYDDAGGAFASRFWWLCRWIGLARVAVLDGGWNAWLAAGRPVERSAPAGDATRGGTALEAGAALVDTVDLETIAADLGLASGETGETTRPATLYLIDAREAERYRGEHEPIDPVAGHIPYAVNYPFAGNLDGDGRFLSPETLRRRYQPALDAAGDRRAVLYCGSGVTATHDLLAMAHAGLPLPALYAGSFSEWVTRDGGRYPVARQGD